MSDAVQLAQRRLVAGVVARGVDVVDLVVAADVLERRDAEREIERRVRERQVAHVGDDSAEARHVGAREVDADELVRTERDEAGEIRRLGEGVADVEHVPLAVVARERPRDLERALVADRGRAQATRPRGAVDLARLRPLGRREREPAVEHGDAVELLAPHELAQEPGPRERPVAELLERARAAVGLGRRGGRRAATPGRRTPRPCRTPRRATA